MTALPISYVFYNHFISTVLLYDVVVVSLNFTWCHIWVLGLKKYCLHRPLSSTSLGSIFPYLRIPNPKYEAPSWALGQLFTSISLFTIPARVFMIGLYFAIMSQKYTCHVGKGFGQGTATIKVIQNARVCRQVVCHLRAAGVMPFSASWENWEV